MRHFFSRARGIIGKVIYISTIYFSSNRLNNIKKIKQGFKHGIQMRYRRFAKRRQIHLFNAPHKAGIEAANFPFCTIEPNTGVVPMPDPRLGSAGRNRQTAAYPANNDGIRRHRRSGKGASKGEGLGNQFLTNIRETEAIGHVVRCFENDNIIHVNNKVDPADDIGYQYRAGVVRPRHL